MFRYIFVIILAILAYFFNSPPSLDLGRYYEMADMVDVNTSIFTFAIDMFFINVDFIYFTSFLITRKIGLPVQLINFIFVGLYYLISIKILELYSKDILKSKSSYVNFVSLFMITSVGIYIIFSISRNLAAISFFLLGLYYLVQKKQYFFIFWIISIFTHIGILLYISLFALFYFVIPYPKIKYKKILITILAVSTFFFGRYIPIALDFISRLSFFNSYSRYLIYTEISESSDILANLGVLERLSYYFFSLTLFLFFFILKQYSRAVWGGFGIFLFLLLSFDFSVMFIQRSVMFLLPFQGILAISIYKEIYNKPRILDLQLFIMTLSILLFLGYLYSYRGMEMF